MTKWEYMLHRMPVVDSSSINDSVAELNGMGAFGWEIVAWLPDPKQPAQSLIVLKRSIAH